MYFGVCDVRDVALAHLKAMTIPAAAGKRFIICDTTVSMSDIAKTLDEEFAPQGYKIPTTNIPNWISKPIAFFRPEMSKLPAKIGVKPWYNTELAQNVLGLATRNWKLSVLGNAYSLIERGAVPKTEKYTLKPEYL